MTVSLILATLCEVGNQDKGLDGVVQMVDHGGMLMSAGREGVILNVREDPRAPSKKIRGLQGPTMSHPQKESEPWLAPPAESHLLPFPVRLG